MNDTVDSLVEDHSVADIIAFVGNEIHIDTDAFYQEAQSASKLIANSLLNPMFLDPVEFLKSDGDEAEIGDPSDKTQRPVDITYARFRCTMHGSSIDPRVINAPDLSFNFCRRLPQHIYDDTTSIVTLIANSPRIPTSSTTARALGAWFDVIASILTKSPGVTSPNGTSPAMTRFLSSQKSSRGTKKGYYGDLNF